MFDPNKTQLIHHLSWEKSCHWYQVSGFPPLFSWLMSFPHFLRVTFSSKGRQPPTFLGKKIALLRTCRGNEANPDIGMESKRGVIWTAKKTKGDRKKSQGGKAVRLEVIVSCCKLVSFTYLLDISNPPRDEIIPPSPKRSNSSHLKMDGRNPRFLLGMASFWGVCRPPSLLPAGLRSPTLRDEQFLVGWVFVGGDEKFPTQFFRF